VYDVDCTAGGEKLCGQYGVKGYPSIKYWKNGGKPKGGSEYNGGRDFKSLVGFVESTFKASCDATTGKGCNDQEKRFIEKTKDKSPEELAEELKAKEKDLKDLKEEKKVAEKEFKEKEKKWKSKETALTKAVELIKQFTKAAKGGGKKSGKGNKDEM